MREMGLARLKFQVQSMTSEAQDAAQQRPYGSPPHTTFRKRKVMKPILPHGIAPSPLVLSFLRAQVRNAFESPIAHCAELKSQRYGYSTSNRIQCGSKPVLGRHALSNTQGGGRLHTRTIITSRCLLEQRPLRTGIDSLPAIRQTSQNSVLSRNITLLRSFSTTPTNQAWNIFNTAKMRRLAQLQGPAPPPDESSPGATGYSSSLGRIMRPTNELKMRCTELDEHGNVTLVSGEFKKSELIAKVCH